MSKKQVSVKVAFLGDPKIGKSDFIKNYAGEKSVTKEKYINIIIYSLELLLIFHLKIY